MLGDIRIVEDMVGVNAEDVNAATKDGRCIISEVDNDDVSDIFLDIWEVSVDALDDLPGMDTLAVCDSKSLSIVTFTFVWGSLKGISEA